VASALVAILGVVVLQLLIAIAGRARATLKHGRSVYGVILPGKIVFAAAILILGGLPIVVLLRGDDWRIIVLLLPLFLLCILALPGPIVVDPAAGISTRRWYGRAKRIKWDEIERMDWTTEMQQTVVIGTRGQKIIHTGFHSSHDDFLQQISTLAKHPSHAVS
jgi:hypothetical protein